MQNLRLYLPILMGLAIFLLVAFAVYHRKKRHPQPPVSTKEHTAYEEFHCIKSSMKQVNEKIYIAQLVFTNRLDVTLDTQSKVPRQISED